MSRADLPHFVYRIYDNTGQLLYIGCARDVDYRIEMHKATTTLPCWADIRYRYGHHTAEEFPTLAAARAAERAAIKAEAPLHNRQHNPKRFRRVAGEYVTVVAA